MSLEVTFALYKGLDMKLISCGLSFCLLLLISSVQSAEIHSYNFSGPSPVADQAGTLDLTEFGSSLVYDSTGFVTCDGNSASYLEAGAVSETAYTVSFWFRIDSSSTNQSNYSAIIASDQGGDNGSFQIGFNGGKLRVDGKKAGGGGFAVVMAQATAITVDTWHLVTMMVDPAATDKIQLWFNDTPAILSPHELGSMAKMALGINRNRSIAFDGDIADVRIYDSNTVWDDTTQASTFAAGLTANTPVSTGTLVQLIGTDATGLPSAVTYENAFEIADGYSLGSFSDSLWQTGGDVEVTSGSAGNGQWLNLGSNPENGPHQLTYVQAMQEAIAYAKFRIKPVCYLQEELPDTTSTDISSQIAFVYDPNAGDDQGELFILTETTGGDLAWTSTGYVFPLEASSAAAQDWMELTFRLNYTAGKWDLYVNGVLLIIDSDISSVGMTSFHSFDITHSGWYSTGFDEFYVGAEHPLFQDQDHDGIDDAFETLYGLDPLDASDRYGDGDGDGLTNIIEFTRGTNPGNADTDFDQISDANDANPLSTYLTYFEDFESYPLGSGIVGMNGWTTSGSGAVMVQDQLSVSGSQALQINTDAAGNSLRAFQPISTMGLNQVWSEFSIIPGGYDGTVDPALNPASATSWYFTDAGDIRAYDGAAAEWVQLDTAADMSGWQRVTILKDYGTQTWSLWLNGDALAYHLGFSTAQSTLTEVSVETGSVTPAVVDNIRIQTDEIAGIEYDFDGDGMEDHWELNYFGSLSRDGTGDFDGDELKDLNEWLAQGNPDKTDTDDDGLIDVIEYLMDQPLNDALGSEGWSDQTDPWQSVLINNTPGGYAYQYAEGYLLASDDFSFMSYEGSPFLAQTISGDFEISARIPIDKVKGVGAQAGLMVRKDTSSESPLFGVKVKYWKFPNAEEGFFDVYMTHRANDLNASFTNQRGHYRLQDGVTNAWLKIRRNGNLLTAYYSADGVRWHSYQTIYVDLNESVLVGMFMHGTKNEPYKAVAIEEVTLSTQTGQDSSGQQTSVYYSQHLDTDGDGISDYDEAYYLFTDYQVADVGAASTVATLVGNSTTASTGVWETDGDTLFSRSIQGSLSYSLNIPADGTYRLALDITQHNTYSLQQSFELAVYIDGIFVALREVEADPDGMGYFYLPQLTSGNHDLRIEWINGARDSSLRINQLALEAFAGDDLDQDGQLDWMQTRLSHITGIDESSVGTLVSPFTLEGKSIAVDDLLVTTDFDPNDVNATSYAVTAEQALLGEFFAHLPLNPEGATQTQVTDQAGLATFDKTITWDVLNLLDPTLSQMDPALDPIELWVRLNDSVLLSAFLTDGTNQVGTVDVLEVDDNGLETLQVTYNPQDETEVFPHQFTSGGQYLLRASTPDGSGGTINGEILIQVISADLNPAPIVIQSAIREWVPEVLDDAAVISSDLNLIINETTQANDDQREFDLFLSGIQPARIISRLGEDGPILDVATIKPLRDQSRLEIYSQTLEEFADGSIMVENRLTFSGELPDDFNLTIEIVKAGITFLDGTLERTVTAADFEGGVYTYRMIRAEGVDGGNCHRVTYYQGDDLLGLKY